MRLRPGRGDLGQRGFYGTGSGPRCAGVGALGAPGIAARPFSMLRAPGREIGAAGRLVGSGAWPTRVGSRSASLRSRALGEVRASPHSRGVAVAPQARHRGPAVSHVPGGQHPPHGGGTRVAARRAGQPFRRPLRGITGRGMPHRGWQKVVMLCRYTAELTPGTFPLTFTCCRSRQVAEVAGPGCGVAGQVHCACGEAHDLVPVSAEIVATRYRARFRRPARGSARSAA